MIVYSNGAVTVHAAGDDAFRIHCSRCGERVTYRFQSFTQVEADRHERWCSVNKQQICLAERDGRPLWECPCRECVALEKDISEPEWLEI
jgi:hypothetical protein